MAIVISENGRNAKRVERSSFEDEAALQAYIHQNPECLPVDELGDDVRVLILAREVGTASGPIDALGVDQEGIPYIIETKLYKNPDKRRVIAQALDYGASLWAEADQDAFLARVKEAASAGSATATDLSERVASFFSTEMDAASEKLSQMAANVSRGQFRFIVLMDKLDDRLKDLIAFLNANSEFSVYGVELELYKHESMEILIPRLYGAEVRKDTAKATGREQRAWDEQSFFEDAEKRLAPDQLAALRRLYEFTKARTSHFNWGKGISAGSIVPKFPQKEKYRGQAGFYELWSDGSIRIYHHEMPEARRDQFCSKTGLPCSLPGKNSRSYETQEWIPKAEALMRMLDQFIREDW